MTVTRVQRILTYDTHSGIGQETLVRCKDHLYTACCEQSIPTDNNMSLREHSRDALFLGFALSRICCSQILLYFIEQSVRAFMLGVQ